MPVLRHIDFKPLGKCFRSLFYLLQHLWNGHPLDSAYFKLVEFIDVVALIKSAVK